MSRCTIPRLWASLSTLAVWVAVGAVTTGSWRRYLAFAALAILAATVRPGFVLFPPALLLVFHKRFRGMRPLLAGFTAVLLVVSIAPWIAFQERHRENEPSLLNVTLLLGSYPQLIHKNPVFQGYPYLDDPVFREKSKGIPASLEYIARRARAEPARYLQWYGIGKTRMFLSWPILVGQGGGPFLYPVTSTMYDTNAFFKISLVASNMLHNVLGDVPLGVDLL